MLVGIGPFPSLSIVSLLLSAKYYDTNLVIGHQLGMCALLFYHPSPLDPVIGVYGLRLLVLRAHL